MVDRCAQQALLSFEYLITSVFLFNKNTKLEEPHFRVRKVDSQGQLEPRNRERRGVARVAADKHVPVRRAPFSWQH